MADQLADAASAESISDDTASLVWTFPGPSPPSIGQWEDHASASAAQYAQVNEALSSHEAEGSQIRKRSFLISTAQRQHRFIARHRRVIERQNSSPTAREVRAAEMPGEQNEHEAQSQPVSTSEHNSPRQLSTSKGYSDGIKASQTFAAFGNSRLGFTGQFTNDAMAAMSDGIFSGSQDDYRSWFSAYRP
jgi:hypothetical protein